MFLLREIPPKECLERLINRYPEIEPQAVETIMTFLHTATDLIHSFDEVLAKHGLTQGRFAILAFLNRNPETAVNQTQLADAYGVSKATVTGLIDGLERDALVERLHDPADRRASLVKLTDAGTRFMDAILPHHFKRTAEVFVGFSPADHASLLRLMGKIRAGFGNVKALEQNGTLCCPSDIHCRRAAPPASESPAT